MSETKFTKGPWVMSYATDGNYPHCIDGFCNEDGERFELCGILGSEVDTEASEQSIANTHLISQAPAMYEMLDNVKHLLAQNLSVGHRIYIEEIENLLAKCRGE